MSNVTTELNVDTIDIGVSSTAARDHGLGKRLLAVLLLAAALMTFTVMKATNAFAESGAHGVVAVHSGSWGYSEMVFGRGTTQDMADSSAWDITGILSSALGGPGILVGLDVYLVGSEARQAARSGECFALVRPFWGLPYFPAVESWGCR